MLKNSLLTLIFAFIFVQCQSGENHSSSDSDLVQDSLSDNSITETQEELMVGAARFDEYLPMLEGKSIAMVVNPTSEINGEHLVDILLEKGISIKKIFAPEHGFRGKADAGAVIKDGKDIKTGLPIKSLYGKNKKPSVTDLKGIDVVIFDIQDVGARFYTYISTMHYVMEACAEQQKRVVVLDRPNPNGHYVDGPIREASQKSFVGMNPIPIVHGMTVGEYAQMLNGEKWLKNSVQCDLQVVTCQGYDHNTFYELPVKPSPNLPNIRSIYLYPSFCLFEGTTASVGRGTPTPFQIYGHPNYKNGNYDFTPKPTEGATSPKHNGKNCNGFSMLDVDLETLRNERQLNLSYLINFYKKMPVKKGFFNSFFKKLAGTTQLEKDIRAGKSAEEIRASWQAGLEEFKSIRRKYLLYSDFE
jgi:uncharacterized protein YbbC (DUF1343 family)